MKSKPLPRLVCVVLVLVSLVASGCFPSLTEAADSSEWQDVFSYFLAGMKAVAPGEDLDCFDYGYLFYDIDKDGVPELITQTGTCEADYTGTVYFLKDGKVERAGEFVLGHSCLFSDPDHNGVIVSGGHMGWAWVTRVSLLNGQLAEEQIFEETLDYTENPDAEYTEIGDIVPGAEYMEMDPIMGC